MSFYICLFTFAQMTNALLLRTVVIEMSKVAILGRAVALLLRLGKHWETLKEMGVGG